MKLLTFAVGLSLGLLPLATPAGTGPQVSPQTRQLHERLLVLDTHLDTPAYLAVPGFDITHRYHHHGSVFQVDLPRMWEGGLDGGFWVIYTPQGPRGETGNRDAQTHGLLRMNQIREMVATHPDAFEIALTADDAERIAAAGKRVVFISMENASPLASDPGLLAAYHRLGLRMLGITHVRNNDFGDSSTDTPEWGGLSPAGKQLVAEANRLGLVLDASHASDGVFDDLIALSKTPIILSHSGADAVFAHGRNRDDERLRALARQGGVIHVNAFAGYLIPGPDNPAHAAEIAALGERYGDRKQLSAERYAAYLQERDAIDAKHAVQRADFDDYMKHLLHILEVMGPDHVGIGADWDGGGGVVGLEDITSLPKITQALLDAGYGEQDIAKIWGGNLLRLVRQAQAAAVAEKAKP